MLAPVRVIQVTDYGSPFAGSFVPMVLSTLLQAQSRGWRVGVVLPGRAREAPWVADFAEAEIELHFAEVEGRRERAKWLERVLGREPGPAAERLPHRRALEEQALQGEHRHVEQRRHEGEDLGDDGHRGKP